MKISNILPRFAILATSLFVSQAYAASAFLPTDPDTGLWTGEQPLGSIGPIELSDSNLAGGVKGYRGWFENGAWQGDLIEYDVSAGGALSTSIDLTGTSPVQTDGTNWSAYLQFDANDDVADYWDDRKIITRNGNSQVPFRWANLSDAQKTAIDSVGFANGNTSSNILNFVRGDRSLEFPDGSYRARFSLLGDIIHSKPEYVQTPNADIPDSTYVTFINDNLTRAPRVYVGANDGMLHAFNAATGDEVWAYIPSMVIDNLSKLAGRPFSHSYFVDGGTTVSDAFFDSSWHTLLIGSLGGGGKGLYALDVTDPDLSSESSTDDADQKAIGELLSTNGTYGDDVGHIFGPAVIAKLNDDDWYVISGNGVSSVNGVAKLFLINLETGDIDTLTAGSANNNGLSAPAVVDTDNDGKADIVYAGDIDGDLWKFDLTGAVPGNWNTAYKLYDGVGTQPITTAPDVTNHPVYGYLVMYGTGRLYTAVDIINTDTQALFGIWDKGTAPVADTKLAQLFSDTHDYISGAFSETVRTITTETPINWATHTGWITELPAGERVLTPVQLRAGRIKATVTNPNGFKNWLVEVDFASGGYADQTIFDLDQNSLLDEDDRVDANLDTLFDSLLDIPMAWQRRNGNMSQVTIARVGQGIDTMFLNYLNPAIVPPGCTGDCDGGLGGGHMDVDTDTNLSSPYAEDGLGGKTIGHEHEYDDKVNRTYVDYFDIDPEAGGKLKNVNDAGIAIGTKQFIILIANADLSPGSELTIGHREINVVEYQRMIHKAMAGWNGNANSLKDPGNNSLVFTLADLLAVDGDGVAGTLRSTFNSLAIINGGLHPTQTGCVNKDNALLSVNGRWRNGSLIIQLVDVTHFAPPYATGEQPLDRLTVQNPTDMYKSVVLASGDEVVLAEDLSDPLDGDSDDATSPLYEVYGGLVASGEDEFLYESTLFWHYDDKGVVSEALGAGKACYGDPDWETDTAAARGELPLAFLNELLVAAGFVDDDGLADLPDLIAAFDALEASGCGTVSDKDGGCKDEYEALLELVELSLLVSDDDASGDGSLPSTGLEGAGTTPVVIEGAVTSGGVTSGPNFQSGRRTWIDILPE